MAGSWSETENRDNQLLKLKTKFEERNYPTEIIETQFNRAKNKERKDVIFQQRKPKNKKDDKIRLIFTRNDANPPLYKWLRECKQMLAKNVKAKALGERIQISSKQPKNIKKLVGGCKNGSGLVEERPPDAGCSKCNHCHACQILQESKTFSSTNTKRKYSIRQKLNCASDHLSWHLQTL